MNATVVIPTYWAGDDARANAPGTYDHSTRLNADNPELDRCLASLEQVRDIPRIILLVVCPVSATADVSLRVHEIVDAHPTLKVREPARLRCHPQHGSCLRGGAGARRGCIFG